MITDKKYLITKDELSEIARMGGLAACEMLGVSAELPYSKAVKIYGQFFKDMVRAGRITPVRVGNGKNGTHWYAVMDILALKQEEKSKAKLL